MSRPVHFKFHPNGVRVGCSSRSFGGLATTDKTQVTCKRCLKNLANDAARSEQREWENATWAGFRAISTEGK